MREVRHVIISSDDKPYDITIDDGRYTSVTPSRGSDHNGPESRRRLLIPAFVNLHAHLDKAFLFETATADRVYVDGYYEGSQLLERKARFEVSEVLERAERLVRWSIEAGVTAIRSHVDVDPYARLVGVEALLALKEKYREVLDLQIVTFPQDGIFRDPVVLDLMREACRMGADVVGGKPSADADAVEHIRAVFDIAQEFDRDIDLHIDTWVGKNYDYNGSPALEVAGMRIPSLLETAHVAREVVDRRWHGRVTCSHLAAYSVLTPENATALAQVLKATGITVVACPVSNLSSSAQTDTYDVRRGVAHLPTLATHGVRCALATDNVGDAWNLFGGPDLFPQMLTGAVVFHRAVVNDLWDLLDMSTVNPAAAMGLPDRSVREGNIANFTVVDAESLWEAVVRVRPRTLVVRGDEELFSSSSRRSFAPVFGDR